MAKITEHSYWEWIDVDADTHKRTCSCGNVETEAHTYCAWITRIPVSCIENGEEYRVCSKCNKEETRMIIAEGHQYKSVITEPNCTEQGYTTHTCEGCGECYVDSYVDVLSHSAKVTITAIPATCTEPGRTEGTCCERCGITLSESKELSQLGHCFTIYVTNNDATHLADGTKTAKCDRCNVNDTIVDVGSKLSTIANGVCGDELVWWIDNDGMLTISGRGLMTEYKYSEKAPWYDYRSSITKVAVTDEVTSIGSYAFYDCTKITVADLGTAIEAIGKSAFENCSGLTSITLPGGVMSLGPWAFYKCTNLTSIKIPGSVTEIGSSAFSTCSNLASITVESSNLYYSSDNYGVLYNKNKTILIQAPNNLTGKYTIPETVTTIGSSAFYNCAYITSAVIPDSVIDIGSSAFQNCSRLKQVSIGNGVTTIGKSAFKNCKSITNLTLPDSVTAIADETFYSCEGLVSVTIGDGVAQIGTHAFYGCTDLRDVIMGTGVKQIGMFAFYGCIDLENLYIEDLAAWCAIEFYTLYDNPLSENLYVNNVLIKELVIPEGVTVISEYAFYYCEGLVSLVIPHSVESIESSAFNACYNLKDVYYQGTESDWDEIQISDSNEELLNATRHYPRYTIAYELDGGTGSFSQQEKGYGENITIANTVPTKTGYIFHGWAIQYGSTVKYRPGDTYSDNVSTTLYAVWKACEHHWDNGVMITQPTHTTFGECTYTCADCSATKTEQVAKTSDHSYGFWTKVDAVNHQRICICGDLETAAHNWDAGMVTVEPTEETEGKCVYTCQSCGTTKTEALPAIEHVHSYTAVVTAPTCTQQGYTTHTCTNRNCKSSYIDSYTDALGHSFDEWEILDQVTCTEDGEERRVCLRCEEQENRIIPASRHDFGTNNSCANCGCPAYTLGDFDGDEKVTDSDAIYLLRHTLFPNLYPVEQSADVNNDGIVSDADAIYLLRYTLFPDRYPLAEKEQMLG